MTKMIEMLELICFNHLLYIAHHEIYIARDAWNFKKHLSKNTFNIFQLKNAQCSFDNKLSIKCSCVDESSLIHFISLRFVNLIVMSTELIINWLKKIKTHLNMKNIMMNWHVHHMYHDAKLNKLACRLMQMNRSFLSEQDQSNFSVICVTTIDTFNNHVALILFW